MLLYHSHLLFSGISAQKKGLPSEPFILSYIPVKNFCSSISPALNADGPFFAFPMSAIPHPRILSRLSSALEAVVNINCFS